MIRSGETYTLPRDLSRAEALSYWHRSGNEVYVVQEDLQIVGTYFLRANQQGGGAHVANCGYITGQTHTGRGVARMMCLHSLRRAQELQFRAMQFNFVVSTNVRATGLWQSCGFEIVGRLPEAFLHPALGYVDAFIMFRRL